MQTVVTAGNYSYEMGKIPAISYHLTTVRSDKRNWFLEMFMFFFFFSENGVLSFENPNYTLGNSFDDALNSNTTTTNSTTAQNNTSNDGQLDGGLAALGNSRYQRNV